MFAPPVLRPFARAVLRRAMSAGERRVFSGKSRYRLNKARTLGFFFPLSLARLSLPPFLFLSRRPRRLFIRRTRPGSRRTSQTLGETQTDNRGN